MNLLEDNRLSAIRPKAVATVRQCSILKVVYLVFSNVGSSHCVLRTFKLSFTHLCLPQPLLTVVPHRSDEWSNLSRTSKTFEFRRQLCRIHFGPRWLTRVFGIYLYMRCH